MSWFLITLPPGGDPDVVEATLFEEIERIAKEGITDQELAKVRNIRLADYWRTLATIDGKADLLGDHEVFHGDYRKALDLAARIEAVTAEQIRDMARKVFRAENSTVGTVIPADASVEVVTAGDAP
jgi:zinc protease